MHSQFATNIAPTVVQNKKAYTNFWNQHADQSFTITAHKYDHARNIATRFNLETLSDVLAYGKRYGVSRDQIVDAIADNDGVLLVDFENVTITIIIK